MPSRRSTQVLVLVLLSSPWLLSTVESGAAITVLVMGAIGVLVMGGIVVSGIMVSGIMVLSGLAPMVMEAVGMVAAVLSPLLIGAAHAAHLSGQTTWMKLELHRLPTIAQF